MNIDKLAFAAAVTTFLVIIGSVTIIKCLVQLLSPYLDIVDGW